jgi:hypothetical protein
MNGFKKCENGHFFKEDLTACPYCPSSSSGSSNAGGGDLNKTIVAGGDHTLAGNDNAKTQVFGSQGNNSGTDQTKVFGSGNAAPAGQPKRDLNRTYIAGVTDDDTTASSPGGVSNDATPRSTRRIVGWILSYTLDPMGVDYRIYEGNNSIGRDAGNSITITKDTTISGKHANILYKKGKFYIKDEMAANGTFVNDEELEIEKAYPINDGDIIRLAKTTFIFKCSEILEKH